jgi:hypothetical protein
MIKQAAANSRRATEKEEEECISSLVLRKYTIYKVRRI